MHDRATPGSAARNQRPGRGGGAARVLPGRDPDEGGQRGARADRLDGRGRGTVVVRGDADPVVHEDPAVHPGSSSTRRLPRARAAAAGPTRAPSRRPTAG